MILPYEVEPLPGLDVSAVLRPLRQLLTDLVNIQGGSGNSKQRVVQYQDWSNRAAQSLGYVVDSASVEHIILTSRHWMLQQWTNVPNSGDPIRLVDTETQDRLRVIERIVTELTAIEHRVAALEPVVFGPDTNFFLHNELPVDEVDWLSLANAQPVRVLVPWVVVRELDKHKRAGKNITVSETNKQPIRTRARVTLRDLGELFADDPSKPVVLRTGVRIELLLDSVKHRRIDDPDSEIIDRLLTAQSLLGRPIAVVTGDRSMEFAATVEGLRTVSVAEPAEPTSG